MKVLNLLLKIGIFIILTVLTQIGGVIYLVTILITTKIHRKILLKRCLLFIGIYFLATFIILPVVAPYFGRVKIENTENLEPRSFFYTLSNRDYVSPKLLEVLQRVSVVFSKKHPEVKVVYLDANFPFINGFPLLPHLSHNDGKKIDLSFVYKDSAGALTTKKPSVSGYGIYIEPLADEYPQTEACKKAGYWQYDFTKYVSFGNVNPDLTLAEPATRDLSEIIMNQNETSKLFIEPHLAKRLKLKNSKLRFHGCKAVRHDDHIHFQIE